MMLGYVVHDLRRLRGRRAAWGAPGHLLRLLPSFVLVLSGAPYNEQVRHNRRIQAFLAGASAAVFGVILIVSLPLIRKRSWISSASRLGDAFLIIVLLKVDVAWWRWGDPGRYRLRRVSRFGRQQFEVLVWTGLSFPHHCHPKHLKSRVTLWRRLRRLGAISPVGGLQILPAHDECVEAFQWLAQEIRQEQGDAVLCASRHLMD